MRKSEKKIKALTNIRTMFPVSDPVEDVLVRAFGEIGEPKKKEKNPKKIGRK